MDSGQTKDCTLPPGTRLKWKAQAGSKYRKTNPIGVSSRNLTYCKAFWPVAPKACILAEASFPWANCQPSPVTGVATFLKLVLGRMVKTEETPRGW